MRLKQSIEAKKAQIESIYNANIQANITYKNSEFQADDKSINALRDIILAISSGVALPAGFVWIDANNKHITANKAFVNGLYSAIMNRRIKLFSRLISAKELADSSKDIKGLDGIEF